MKNISLILISSIFFLNLHSQERRLALVIGNGNYSASTLANPENDARSMEAALKEIGFTVLKYENLKQKEMAKAIDDFGNKLKNYNIGLFFYAGHGIQSKGFNYLIPVDAELNEESDIEFDCVRADRLLSKMETAKSRINIIILDACRDNPYERSWSRASRSRGLATMMAPAGSVIAFATSPGSTASDGAGRNGLYTSALLNYISEPGITAIQMFQKVTAYVLKKSGSQQLPWVSTSLTGDFYLVPGSGKSNLSIKTDFQPETVSPVPSAELKTEKSIAVLSFKNLTGYPDRDYLAVMQHEILYQELCKLGQVKPLRVVGNRTTASFENNRLSIPEIARDQDVEYLIEGNVLGTGDSITLMVRLIQAFPQERTLWAHDFTSDMKNLLKLYNNICGQISKKIGLELVPQDIIRLPEPRQVNPEVMKAYYLGMAQLNLMTEQGVKKGMEYLNLAISLDPDDAFANAALSLGYLEIAHNGMDRDGDARLKGEMYALKALEIDSTIAEVHAALAGIYLYQKWNYDEAEKHFKRALELNPNLDMAHYHYAWGLYLWGRMDEAIAEHKLAQKYDPLNPQHTAWLGGLYCYAGKYEEAIAEALKAFEIQKDYPVSYQVLGDTYRRMGRFDEAIEMHKKLHIIRPERRFQLGLTYLAAGKPEEAEKILAEYDTESVSPESAYFRARLYAAFNRKDDAFKWLNYEPPSVFLPWLAVADECEPLHSDPRWNLFLKKVNLPIK